MLDIIAAAVLTIAPISDTPNTTLPACVYEDGNTNGQPCTWTDPDTGRQYWVDSANYR